MDEKGRIKLPAAYRRYVEEHYGPDFYVTSLSGEFARLYPMQEWLEIEQKLLSRGTEDITVKKFLNRTNYYGQNAEMDAQGRLLIHPLLRSSAGLVGEVTVLGYLQYLEVWELDRFKSIMDNEPYTAEDATRLASLGV